MKLATPCAILALIVQSGWSLDYTTFCTDTDDPMVPTASPAVLATDSTHVHSLGAPATNLIDSINSTASPIMVHADTTTGYAYIVYSGGHVSYFTDGASNTFDIFMSHNAYDEEGWPGTGEFVCKDADNHIKLGGSCIEECIRRGGCKPPCAHPPCNPHSHPWINMMNPNNYSAGSQYGAVGYQGWQQNGYDACGCPQYCDNAAYYQNAGDGNRTAAKSARAKGHLKSSKSKKR